MRTVWVTVDDGNAAGVKLGQDRTFVTGIHALREQGFCSAGRPV
jgi:hypothetical protein